MSRLSCTSLATNKYRMPFKIIHKNKFRLYATYGTYANSFDPLTNEQLSSIEKINKSNIISLTYDNAQLKAAGVVPYSKAKNGKVYVLLGRQALYPHASAGLWKGFGGRRDDGETLIFTALREAKEESRAVLGPENCCYNSENLSLDHAIVSEHYQSKYLQLMIPVPWDKDAPSRFESLANSDPYQMEKLAIEWVAFEDLYKVLKEANHASLESGCLPRQMNRTFKVSVDTNLLPLANDFVETLLANFRNEQDSVHLLAKNVMPIPFSLSTDLKVNVAAPE